MLGFWNSLHILRFTTHREVNLWIAIAVTQVELSNQSEVGHRESPAEFGGETVRQLLDKIRSIVSPVPSPLLLLDDFPADVPVSSYHGSIDRLQRLPASLAQDVPNPGHTNRSSGRQFTHTEFSFRDPYFGRGV